MKTDWFSLIGHAVAVAIVIVLAITTFARGAVAPGAMIVIAAVSSITALCLLALESAARFRQNARGEFTAQTGDEASRDINRLNDDQWGGFAMLRPVLWAQVFVVALVFGTASADFIAAASAFGMAVVLAMREMRKLSSSQ